MNLVKEIESPIGIDWVCIINCPVRLKGGRVPGGYGSKKDYKPLHQQLDEIVKKTADGKSGTG